MTQAPITSMYAGASPQAMKSAVSPSAWLTSACNETPKVEDKGLSANNHAPYPTAHSSCNICESECDINISAERPTIISTALALIFAGQCRGLTANIRHLLNRIIAAAICTKPVRTKINNTAGNKHVSAICMKCEKPAAGFILDVICLIMLLDYSKNP